MFIEPKYHAPKFEVREYNSLEPMVIKTTPGGKDNTQAYLDFYKATSYSNDEVHTSEVLLSEKRKFLFTYHPAFFHTTIDSYGMLATVLEQYGKNIHVVLIARDDAPFDFITEYLELEGVSYEVHQPFHLLRLNNYFSLTFFYPTIDTLKLTRGMIEKYEPSGNEQPYRKVILSRAKVPYKSDSAFALTDEEESRIEPAFRTHLRVDDEVALEDFFREHSFEVVYPEEFETFKDQVAYMRTVKLLISLSGSGLTNQLFMKPRQTVVELSNPLINYDPNSESHLKEFHNQYLTIAQACDHTYISAPHQRSVEEIKSKFESSEVLKKLLDD